jgi:hypothetical protein
MRFLVDLKRDLQLDLQRIWAESVARFAAKISARSLAETPRPENPFLPLFCAVLPVKTPVNSL